ncbi:MAG: TIGR03619 family F420-dependent LLM class oxidoreductase [Sphingomonadaceae bacterium]|nr:TIGR03619 family F420-dependent LLM class oxidoreductase [Sphingomonadaceae bacterium]
MKASVNILGLESTVGRDVQGVIDVAVAADRKGIDFVSLGDHLGFNRETHEERRQSYGFPFVLEEPWPEPITFLTAVAACTTQIRLSAFVLIAPLRPALLLAKQLATLDRISNGRVMMGLGVGWQEKEFRAAGMPFDGRFGDLEDYVGAMRSLWGPPPASYKGRNFEFDDFYSFPLPVQGAELPILFGLKPTDRNLDRMARLSQGWALNPADRADFVEKSRELKRRCAEYGRDPEQLEFEVGQGAKWTSDGKLDRDAIRAGVQGAEEDGATIVSFLVRDYCRTEDEIEPFLDFVASLKG